ncbi:type I secretion system permease/ATPase [Campylobacter canadensis]|uniref:Type I secretion system permease/ATPase n=1 Tax=Campylobacter canadensis TaxID=449520 RepID=A0ABS7WPC6_9BACT|nr:type I secretion system permease/ATPase [Campylobacter canadensis]MBZ7986618.1 type I secretion system permease/ATPase [Campylobacter canadensis]MBZ7993977.1 type I secretion system permease/ATPase [Campylobacter canadensis]MBZ7996293.1 type I secretion system permease/ATPase [Campylobacter canadensis]MBZ7997654.1 type I secretion system permease/ATPase [Campylobacter canadensis]MBZ7999309.1 type I secretion system permease/ATPase [Campylobacter canadensis]
MHTNELLECLVLFTHLNKNPYSAQALTAGLPVDKNSGMVELFSTNSKKALFSRAAKKAGYSSSLVKKDLLDIPRLVLPCILVLKDKKACILQAFENNEAVVILPGLESSTKISIQTLEEEYLGYCFYLKKEFSYKDDNSDELAKANSHWFFDTLKRSKGIYIDVLIASFIINLFVLASPLFTMNVYDRVVPNNATETLWVLAIGVFIVYALDLVIKLVRAYFLENASKRSEIIMSSMIYEKVLDIKLSVRPKSVGSFAQNLKEFDTLKSFFASASIASIVDMPFCVIFLLTVYFLAGYLVVVPIVVIILILIYTFSIKNPLQKSIESTYKASAYKNGILVESLNTLETIKSLNAASQAQWVYEEATGEIAAKSIKSKLLSSSISMVTGFLVQFNTIAIVVMGVYMIKDMQLSMGGLIASVILSSRAITPMGQVASLISNFQQTKTAYKSIEDIMQLPVERPDGKKFIRRNNFNGQIDFNNVSFTYPEAKKESLNSVTFKIKEGEKVAIIGKNGSGKTTIEKLILGLYEPTKGSVSIDGIDVEQIDPADLREHIAYVSQDIMLFKGSVRENIIYKNPAASDEEIVKAADIACVSDFVNSHPQGFDMPVYERGEGLSGGQRQSIAIARAFIKDAPIVLLDEPTNSIDTSTEAKVLENIKKACSDKTLVVITHKQSLLSLVDRIIVIDNGKVVLDGPKAKVLNELGV